MAEALAGQILEATQVLHNPQSPAHVRQAANEFVMKVTENPMVMGAAAFLTSPDKPPEARFFAFKLIAGVASKGGLQPQDPSVSQLCMTLLDMLRHSQLAPAGAGAAGLAAVPAFVREKYAQAFAAVVVHGSEWPAGMPQLQQEVLEAGRQSPLHAAIALTFFRDVSEVLQSDSATRLTPQRRKALQAHLTQTAGDLFSAMGVFAGSLFPNNAELDRAAVLLSQELSNVVSVVKFLAAGIDKLLHSKLSNSALRAEVLQTFTDLLTKDIAKDLKEAPDQTKQFLGTIFDLVSFCQPTASLSPEDYDVHKAVAVLLSDFVEANKPSLEKHADLQAKVYGTCIALLRYPSVFIQTEAAGTLPHVIRAAMPKPANHAKTPKGAAPVEPTPLQPPPWLNLKSELLPLVFLNNHKELPANFSLFPLPAGYQQIMALTSEFDTDEDLSEIRTALKCKSIEVMMSMSAAPAAVLQSLEFVHELLPKVLGLANNFTSFEAALSVVERIMPQVKLSAGPHAIEACRALLVMVMQSAVPGPEYEHRRLEFLSRVSPVIDLTAEISAEQGSALVIQVFMHLFKVIEEGSTELRTRALYSFIGVSKAAQKAIKPVLEDIVGKAAGLLQSIPNGQHVLCESLVAASTAAKSFDQQANLLRNLLAPILTRWTGLADLLIVPDNLVGRLLGDRTDLDAARQIILCLEGCFRSSTVPSDPAVASAGGFSKPCTGTGPELNVRNPAGEIVASVFEKLVKLTQTFHSAFPSDMTRPMTGISGQTSDSLRPYLLALDKEELKALTSSLDTKNKDEQSWENAFPPPPGEDPAKVHKGRHAVYLFRRALYQCIGTALSVQDGIVTHPELPKFLNFSLISCMEFCHPYHLEMQLRHVWMILFGQNGLSAASEPLRLALASELLPSLLSAAARTLDRYWQWLQLPEGHPAGVNGDNTFVWAICSGTVMASRTLMEFVTSLVIHGGTKSAETGGAPAPAEAMGATPQGKKKKNRQKAAAGEAQAMTNPAAHSDGSGKPSPGFASTIFATSALLEAVQSVLCSAARWQDPKTIDLAVSAMQAVAVRLMSGGECSDSIRSLHATSPEAPQRCTLVLRFVLQPLVSLCNSPPAPPPGDGALHTVVGKPFSDFFAPEVQQRGVAPSPFAVSIISAMWPIIWGICQIFQQVCKQHQVKAEPQHIAQFPALVDACKMLTTLRRVVEQDVQNMVVALLDHAGDAKMKRAALRALIRLAADPPAAQGETLV